VGYCAADLPTSMKKTVVNSQSLEKQIWPRQKPREFAVDRIRRRRGNSETFPKPATYCHLLPFWSRKTARSVSTVAIPFLHFDRRRPSCPKAENGERRHAEPRCNAVNECLLVPCPENWSRLRQLALSTDPQQVRRDRRLEEIETLFRQ
jgi:hypothetical protein